jgi:hypothetical protein
VSPPSLLRQIVPKYVVDTTMLPSAEHATPPTDAHELGREAHVAPESIDFNTEPLLA